MIKLRDYQKENADHLVRVLLKNRIAYLAGEVRTGKTLTILHACNILTGSQPSFRVVFLTKKKAIGSIKNDADKLGVKYNLEVINYESAHKIDTDERIDLVVCDEAHSGISGYPKPSATFKVVKELFDDHTYLILCSGTPHPESKSQLFHQFNVSPHSPFKKYTFFQWAKQFVRVSQRDYGYGPVNNYDNAIDHLIDPIVRPYFITQTQKESGFDNQVNEQVLYVDMKPSTFEMIELVKKREVIEGKKGIVLADTAVKKQNKVHQMCSGTIKFEDGSHAVFDDSKAAFIADYFVGEKIAIMYYFKAEFEMLKRFFPKWTDDPEEFNSSDEKVFIGQIRSSREGINLSTAQALVFMNIEFSCVSYIQAKDRMTSKDRTIPNTCYYVFSRGGIESKIYKVVQNKQDYSNSIFKKDFDIEDKQMKLEL